MASIDDKVVAMSFESGKFESGVNKTISALEKLKAALHFPSAGKGLDDINAAAKRVDLNHISKGVDGVKQSLESLRLIAIGVMAQIATTAVRTGAAFVKSFTLDPLKAGFKEYATNLNAIQTILANTQAAGTTLTDVNKALKELNEYSDKTIYNFSQMAKNIGTFTAAGVELDVATQSIKGIANLAALSGSNADQASTAMYQLSQAIAAGSVKLQDWNSVVNAGMGGTVFQRALAQTAEAVGTLKDGSVKLIGPMKNVTIAGEAFRQSLSTPGKASWLTSEVLTKTLKQFTGDLNDAELAAMGFNAAQIKAIQQTAKTAQLAATEVKTLAQVLDVAKETAGSGWAETWQIIFGDFSEAKKTFTSLSGAINGFINTNADARNKVLADWKALGGRTVLIDSIKIAFRNLGLVIKPIKDAFRDIFPAKTGKDLYNATLAFKEFAKALKPSAETADKLKRTFAGLFAIFSIVGQIIGGVFSVIGRLFGALMEGSGGFLEITASIGDFLVRVDESLKKGDKLTNFFDGLGDVLAIPVELLLELGGALASLFTGFSSGGFSDQIGGMTKGLNPFAVLLDAIGAALPSIKDDLAKLGDLLSPIFEAYMAFFSGIGVAIGEAASNMNFDAILQVLKTGLFAGLLLMMKNFLGKGSLINQLMGGFSGLGTGIIGNIAGSFRALEGSMTAMQTNIKAKTLKEIAIAIALLVASVVALSFIDEDGLKKGVTAIGFLMAGLLGAMSILGKIAASGGFLKIPFIAASMILLAAAIDVLVIAVYALSKLSWEELLKGLGGVAALLVGITKASSVLGANAAGMIRAGIGVTIIAVAMNILALAVKQMAGLSWTELAKGLSGVAGGLVILAGAMQVMPKGMVLQGAAIVALAVALNILAMAVERFSGMNWAEMGKGLAGIGAALVVIAGAMHLMPKGMVLQAAALILVSLALGKIAAAIKAMGGMSIREIAKGLITLAGALGILAAALMLMTGTFAGAAALGIAAAGLSLLAPVLVLLGKQSWTTIIKGLVALAAALTIIGVAGYLLTGAVPALLGLGAAMLLIGAGIALVGAGIFLIGLGLSAIAVAGPAALGIMVAAMQEFVRGMIENAKLLILGLLEIVEALAATAPKFVVALVKILNSLIDVVIQASPKIAEAFGVLLTLALGVIKEYAPQVIQAAMQLIIDFLTGLRNNIPLIVPLVAEIIVAFLKSLKNEMNKIVTAGANLIVEFIKGVAKNIGLIVKAGSDLIISIIVGISKGMVNIVKAAVAAVIAFIMAVAKQAPKLADAGFKALIAFMDGMAKAIDNNSREMGAAGMRLGIAIVKGIIMGFVGMAGELFGEFGRIAGQALESLKSPFARIYGLGVNIITGLISGLADKAQDLYNKAKEIADKVVGFLKAPWSVLSPSKTMSDLGNMIMLGMKKGLDTTAPKVYDSAMAISNQLLNQFRSLFGIHSPSEVMAEIGKFVGEGFAKGLRGTSADINSAFKELNTMLSKAMVDARSTIISEQKKLDELRKADKQDAKAIAESVKIIQQNEDLLARSTDAHKALLTTLKKEKDELNDLASDYEKVSNKLEKAQSVLADAKQTRDDAIKSYGDQYSALPALAESAATQITEANAAIKIANDELIAVLADGASSVEKVTTAQKNLADAKAGLAEVVDGRILNAAGTDIDIVATYLQDLKGQSEAVSAYNSTLQQLRKLGLDDETYQRLVEEGTADQAFATQLLAGGKTAVQGLNKLDTQLKKESDKLAKRAGSNLYQAGVDAAVGLVNGLLSQKKRLIREMQALADEIVAAFNRRLEARSPSQVFAESGKNAMLGLAQGISNATKVVVNSVETVADAAISALKNTMSNISDIVTSELNPNPTITPILDLTQVRSQAGELGALTNVTPITAAASYGQAASISALQYDMQAEDGTAALGGTSVNFEQNNYSPTALTEIEIYRQTKNQLSQLKSALSLT